MPAVGCRDQGTRWNPDLGGLTNRRCTNFLLRPQLLIPIILGHHLVDRGCGNFSSRTFLFVSTPHPKRGCHKALRGIYTIHLFVAFSRFSNVFVFKFARGEGSTILGFIYFLIPQTQCQWLTNRRSQVRTRLGESFSGKPYQCRCANLTLRDYHIYITVCQIKILK
jgi:hypothetical protein